VPLVPPPSKRLVKFPFPLQGLNSTVPSLVLSKGYCPRSDMIRFGRGEVSSQAVLAQRAPFGVLTFISGAFTQQRVDGTFVVYAATTDTFKTYDFTSDTWFTVPGTVAAVGHYEDFWSFADVFGEVFASNGAGSLMWTADGASIIDLNALPNPLGYSGRYLVPFAGRLVLANTREGAVQHEDRVRWSVAQSPRDFTSDSSAGANDLVDLPGPITGMSTLGGRNFIHKRSGITAMIETGLRTPSFSFQTVVDGIGAIAGRTLLNIRGVQFFLGADDVYVYDGASAPRPIGEAIRREVFDHLNWAKVGTSFALDYADFHEYHLFVPLNNDEMPRQIYIYNYLDNTWTKRTIPDHTVSGFQASHANSGAYLPVAPATDIWDGVDNTWDTGSDNTSDVWDQPSERTHLVPFFAQTLGAILYPDEAATTLDQAVLLETADWDLDLPGMLKTVDRIRLIVRQRNDATLSLSISTNGGATFTTPVTAAPGAPVGDETSLKTLFAPVTRTTGEFFRLRLTASQRFSLVSWELEVIDRAEVR